MRDFSKELARMEAGLQINEHNLDKCLVEQPELFWEVAKRHAIAVSDRDGAKKALAEVEAVVDTESRTIARNREEKPREKEIDSITRNDPRVERASRKLVSLGHEVALLSALRDAFHMRSDALKDLVKLHIANYFEESSQDKVQRIRREDKIEQRRGEIAKRYSNC